MRLFAICASYQPRRVSIYTRFWAIWLKLQLQFKWATTYDGLQLIGRTYESRPVTDFLDLCTFGKVCSASLGKPPLVWCLPSFEWVYTMSEGTVGKGLSQAGTWGEVRGLRESSGQGNCAIQINRKHIVLLTFSGPAKWEEVTTRKQMASTSTSIPGEIYPNSCPFFPYL